MRYRIKKYIQLTKPGIIMGNSITAVAGFMLASQRAIDYPLFFAMLVGICLVMGSGCVFNNYFDRFLDEKMLRTHKRALVTGDISLKQAIFFGAILGVLGFFILAFYVNWLAFCIAALGFFVYVVLYTLLKSRTVYCTAIGSLAGASPLLVGYVAVTDRFDLAALILFTIMVCWQMPHFFAIAIYRIHDYRSAQIPVLPVKRGYLVTKWRMLIYVIAFIFATSWLFLAGYTGYLYLAASLLLGGGWSLLAIQGFKAKNDIVWAKQMFKLSLVVITTLSVLIAFDISR